jgi:hypothetical protein
VKQSKALAKPLARPGDPYVTVGGKIIEPEGTRFDKEQPKLTAKNFRPQQRRTIGDLPAPPNVMNGVAAVFAYTVLGVGDREICDVLKISTAQLKSLRTHTAYAEFFDIVSNEFINANSELITARIAAYSHDALTTVAHVAFDPKSKNETRLKAADSLLDRGGFAAKENILRGKAGVNDLRIVLVKDDTGVSVDIHSSDGGYNGEQAQG